MGGRLSRVVLILALGLAAGVPAAVAQSPLTFPSERGGHQGSALVLPQGEGPFPAVVLMPSCGGVRGHILEWSQRLARAGYAALIVDSLTPRNLRSNCTAAPAPLSVDDIARDAAAALAHLRKLPLIDKDRLALMGFSYGAMASLRLAGRAYQQRLPEGVPGLKAIAFFYGTCGTDSGSAAVQAASNNLPGDIATPTMMFLGAMDTESPWRFCSEGADRLRGRGQPIAYKLYPNTTHGFDQTEFAGPGRMVNQPGRGSFLYRYNPEATEDAWRETQAFFARTLAR